MDLLEEHEEELLEVLQRGVRSAVSPEELELLLVDTTSSYFETDYDDAERAEIAEEWAAYDRGEGKRPAFARPQVVNEPAMRLRGHSKDHRPDKPQVVIGMVATAKGRLLVERVYPGNRQYQTITEDLLLELMKTPSAGRAVAVMDSGMGRAMNLVAIDALEGGPDRISGVPLRNSKQGEEILSRPGRWRQHPTKTHFQVRVVELPAEESPSGRAEVWIATRNEKNAAHSKRKLDKQVARVRAVLDKDDRLDDHNREVCNLLSHKTLRRFVRESKDGRRLFLNKERVRVEERRAGVKLIRSTLVDRPPLESLAAYEALLDLENNFRTFKNPLKLRPMHHRASRRIRAHVLICALALACLQEAESRTGQRFDALRKIFGAVRATQMEQGKTRFWQRGEWSDDALAALEKMNAKPGPRTWGASRETSS